MNAPIKNTLTFHQALIDCLCETFPEARTRGFFAALKKLPDADYVPDMLSEKGPDAWISRVRFVPDAYAINEQDRTVTMFEVVDKHDIPTHKIHRMIDLAWALDEDYYRLGLVRLTLAGATAYDVMGMSMCFMFDKARGIHSEPEKRWQLYTNEATDRRLFEGPPVTQESIDAVFERVDAKFSKQSA